MQKDKLSVTFKVAQLIAAHIKDNLTPNEATELDQWLNGHGHNKIIFEKITSDVNLKKSLLEFNEYRPEAALAKISARIDQHPSKTIHIHRYRWFAVAATMLLFLSIGGYFFHIKNQAGLTEAAMAAIKPGYSKAVLTLADGTEIMLDRAHEGSLALQDNAVIMKTAEGRIIYDLSNQIAKNKTSTGYNTITTPRGGQYEVILPDKTHVWLNALTSLKYPTSFDGDTRTVELDGEAYFEVSKNKQKVFTVTSATQTVEVLGTRFNVNTYRDEPGTKTTLLEGSVNVTSGTLQKTITPGQQAELKDHKLQVTDANTDEVIAWKNGDFIFKNDDFKTNMRKLERWYNVEVFYDESAPQNLELGGWVSRSKNISAVLKLMELTGKVHFKVEGRRITVTR